MNAGRVYESRSWRRDFARRTRSALTNGVQGIEIRLGEATAQVVEQEVLYGRPAVERDHASLVGGVPSRDQAVGSVCKSPC